MRRIWIGRSAIRPQVQTGSISPDLLAPRSMKTGRMDMMMPPNVPAKKMAFTKLTAPKKASRNGGRTMKASIAIRVGTWNSSFSLNWSTIFVRKLSEMTQKDVSIAQKANTFTSR